MKKRAAQQRNLNSEGERRYERWSRKFETNRKLKRVYAEESAKMDLWLQLAEARKAAGLTQAQVAKRLGVSQAQVARIEKRGYENYTITTLKRYVQALKDAGPAPVVLGATLVVVGFWPRLLLDIIDVTTSGYLGRLALFAEALHR